ncbi:hypothetical protein QTP81_16050 [Alteromonas sp. ASW11-36]|uniref:STAS/SEC14 domain-containing protein n=1 Tax=Alteromonas arenosi TaxID=3055817 RepID=A0ABT7T0Z5_9ALTE|nr:hypothetical protein [Alteromonas sp. ASW11-36]MDM7862118.1 hypothetical protein [Alteromonas sp. ASW11-36]
MKIFDNPNAELRSKFGQYQIAVLGDVVAVSAEGIADKKAIERYGRDMMDVINKFSGKNWAFLGLLHGQALLTKEAESALRRSIQWRALHGMALSALVTGETVVETIVKNQFERVYEQTGIQVKIFETEQGALNWLAERGFNTVPHKS